MNNFKIVKKLDKKIVKYIYLNFLKQKKKLLQKL